MKRFAIIAAVALIATAGAHAEYLVNGDFSVTDTSSTLFGWNMSSGTLVVTADGYDGVTHKTNVLETYSQGPCWNTGWQLVDVPVGNWVHMTFEVCAPNNSGKGKFNIYSIDSGFAVPTAALNSSTGYNATKYHINSGYSWNLEFGTSATAYTITQNWGRMHVWRKQDVFIQSRGQILVCLTTGDKADLTGGGYPDNNGPNYWDNVSLTDYPSGRLNGDCDLDQDVDDLDLLTVFTHFTGAQGADEFNRLTWSDGNFDLEKGKYGDGDNDVDNNDLLEAMANYTGGAPVPPAQNNDRADLIYDKNTGEVTIDATEAAGGVITGFNLFNAYQSLFVNTPHTAVMSGTYQSDATEVSEADPFGGGFSGVVSLGNIMPTGWEEADFDVLFAYIRYGDGYNPTVPTDYPAWTYVGDLGTGRYLFDIIIVPEPATLALLGLGGLGVLLRRRRS